MLVIFSLPSFDAQPLWNKTFACRLANVETHRDQVYQSLHTKVVSVAPRTPFMETLDDSRESFMASF